jgi:hypothetical protein
MAWMIVLIWGQEQYPSPCDTLARRANRFVMQKFYVNPFIVIYGFSLRAAHGIRRMALGPRTIANTSFAAV